ncbi:MAG: hypothetical protein AB7E52_08260 [Bdellovibrionales bacterium]
MRQIHRLKHKMSGDRPLPDGRSGLSRAPSGKPSLWMKLDLWIGQLGGLKKKEHDLLKKIRKVEERHQKMRAMRQLRRAGPKLDAPCPSPFAARDNRMKMWLLLAFLYYAFRPRKKSLRLFPKITNG